MSKIDWSKAPEGTEAAHPESPHFYFCWYKRDHYGSVLCMEERNRGQWINMGGRVDFPYGHVLRPESAITWTGEGLPPVGITCLLSGPTKKLAPFHPEWAGRKVKIYSHFVSDRGTKMASYVSEDHKIGGVGIAAMFLPIRMPEQIAAEEREKAINEMAHIALHDAHSNLADFGALYDAGYRKQGEKP